MKKKELQEYRKKDLKELSKVIADKKILVTKAVTDIKADREKNLKTAKNLRGEVARLLTLKREIEIKEVEDKK